MDLIDLFAALGTLVLVPVVVSLFYCLLKYNLNLHHQACTQRYVRLIDNKLEEGREIFLNKEKNNDTEGNKEDKEVMEHKDRGNEVLMSIVKTTCVTQLVKFINQFYTHVIINVNIQRYLLKFKGSIRSRHLIIYGGRCLHGHQVSASPGDHKHHFE